VRGAIEGAPVVVAACPIVDPRYDAAFSGRHLILLRHDRVMAAAYDL
jgi:hypothetical protein